jgi:hypothetical protein
MLVSLQTVKNFLGLTDSSEDVQLNLWLGYADADIKDYCGWDIEQTTYPGAAANGRGDSGYYSGDHTQFLRLRHTPVSSITSIYVDNTGYFGQNPGSFPSTALLVAGTDYALEWDGCLPGSSTTCSYSGVVTRIPDVWTGGLRRKAGEITPRYIDATGNILVSYVAGFPTVPPAVEMAACMFVAFVRRNAQTGGQQIQSEGQGAYNYSLSSPTANAIPELGTIKSALARFKRMAV